MKNKAKQKIIFIMKILHLILFLTTIILPILCTGQPRWVKALLREGNPKEFIEKRNIFSDLSEVGVESDYLYVLYGDYGVIEVYTLRGEYQRSYAFYSQRNGRAELLRNEEGLWLEGKDHTLYLFQNGLFVKKLSKLEVLDQTLFKGEVKRYSENGEYYYNNLFGLSVERQTPEGETEIVLRRPIYDFFADRIPLIILPTLLLCGYIIRFNMREDVREHYKKKRLKKRQDEEVIPKYKKWDWE